MTGYRWRCNVKGCTWSGGDGPTVLDHREKTGHIGARPYFEEPEPVPPSAVPPPLFRDPAGSPARPPRWMRIGRRA